MNEKDIDEILKKSGFKKTDLRRAVLRIFSNTNHALSSKDIESIYKSDLDRVTLFRILKDFEEKCIIHKVGNTEGNPQYAFCHHTGHNHAVHHEHMHFNCTKCHNIFCIEDVEIPLLNLPKGYKVTQWNLNVTGICKNCNTK
jgi:Fur family ferric uptake transcriptional regulator